MLSLLVLVGLVVNIQGQCLTANDNPLTMRSDAAQRLSDARFDFALEALKKISEVDTQNNIIFSPHSLYQALALAYFGSASGTEIALKKALHVPDDFTKNDLQRFYSYEKSVEDERKVRAL